MPISKAFYVSLALGLAWLLPACGSRTTSAPADSGAPSGSRTIRSYEQASTAAVKPLQARAAELAGFLPVEAACEQAAIAVLPPLPVPGRGDVLLRRGSETELVTVFGSDSMDADAGAVDLGQAIQLTAPEGVYAWALYQFPAITPADQEVVQISVRVSNPGFTEGGGYWIALADYARHNWDFLHLTQAETYRHSIGDTETLISPAGNMYLAVLLGGGQSMHVEFVRQTREDVAKTWYVVDPNIAGDHGSWPAAAMSLSGVPMVAYVNNVDGGAYFLQPDPISDFNQPADWNKLPQPVFPMQNADASYLDMVLDPVLGLPRLSLLLDKTHEPSGKNSTVGLSAARLNGQSQLEWLPLELAGVDGAQFSCIARDASTGLYSITTSAENLNSPGAPNFDIERREFDVQQLLNLQNVDIVVERNFGEGLRYPHMRYSPAGNEAFAVRGGFVIYEEPLDSFISIYEELATEPWGSLCFVPPAVSSPTLLGNSYARNGAAGGQLFSAAFDDSLLGVEDEVDSISGAGAWIGGVSQLEYQVDGTPCLAYTYSDGNAVGVRFAIFRNNSWQIEQVSDEPIASDPDHQRIVLDLAVEPPGMFVPVTGRLIIAWEQFNGTTSELRVAVRQPGS